MQVDDRYLRRMMGGTFFNNMYTKKGTQRGAFITTDFKIKIKEPSALEARGWMTEMNWE